ncbi:MAG: SDR family NAD(P)-dependent oxidoreductase [Deltaproteobacteria bacterium]|nr:MAG: SDR family NAD(P)-dependent oxidoreductase [Deltaproteobacteria bacterium]
MRRLEGRVAVVTGAASGIGRALSEALAAKGCALALVDVAEAGLAETSRRIAAAGGRSLTFVADVADRARMQRLPDEVVARCGAVHILVNNAGVTVGATFAEQSLDDFDWIVGVNLWGVVHGCRFFLPHLAREDEAHIVNVSSMFGFLGFPGQASYCLTKAGVKALSEALWTELAHTGIGVTCVHPGGIATNMIRAARIADAAAKDKGAEQIARFGHSPEKAARKIVRAIEANRPRVRIGPEAYVLDWIKRLFPVGTHRLVTALYRRSAAAARAREREAAAARASRSES